MSSLRFSTGPDDPRYYQVDDEFREVLADLSPMVAASRIQHARVFHRRRQAVLLGEHARRLRTEVALAGVEGAHGGEQLGDGAVFDQVAGGAGAHDRQDVFLFFMHGQREDADLRQLLMDAAHGFEA